jgi:hypothetical protein
MARLEIMLAQLECLGVELAGPPQLLDTQVIVAKCVVAHGKIGSSAMARRS